ncbi:MAG TPA: hypothetical protein VN600_03180, partial [Gemmatimonadaceae bacterium]|nr:hypothetical protein [Gemmatimonadaceae bacterium]
MLARRLRMITRSAVRSSFAAPLMALPAPLLVAQNAAHVSSKPAFSEPVMSPDRREIAFVSGGDIWTVPAAGGEARLLVAHAAYDSRPLYSPDGTR